MNPGISSMGSFLAAPNTIPQSRCPISWKKNQNPQHQHLPAAPKHRLLHSLKLRDSLQMVPKSGSALCLLAHRYGPWLCPIVLVLHYHQEEPRDSWGHWETVENIPLRMMMVSHEIHQERSIPIDCLKRSQLQLRLVDFVPALLLRA